MGSDPEKIFDLGIIGGGICGAGIARDAALRGLSSLLFEKNTFGSGTSSKSSRLIHGGIRYLELAWNALKQGRAGESWKNFSFVYSSLRESRILRRIAPAHVRPHELFIPIYLGNKRRRFTVFLGCLVYYFLSLLAGGGKMPRVFWSPRSALQKVPELSPKGLNGGVMIRDHVTDDLELVKAVMASAQSHGAVCHEHAEVTSYGYDATSGAYRLTARMEDKTREFLVRKIINAAGPWVDDVRKAGKERDRSFIEPVAGSHIWVKSFLPCSVLLEAEDGRLFFVIHFGERSRIGTTERPAGDPDKIKPTNEEIDYLLRSVARYFPEHALTRKDILSSDAGVRPLATPGADQNPNAISREHQIRVSPSGIIHMLGVKLTDHRRAAEEVLNRLLPSLLPFNPKAKRRTLTHRVPL